MFPGAAAAPKTRLLRTPLALPSAIPRRSKAKSKAGRGRPKPHGCGCPSLRGRRRARLRLAGLLLLRMRPCLICCCRRDRATHLSVLWCRWLFRNAPLVCSFGASTRGRLNFCRLLVSDRGVRFSRSGMIACHADRERCHYGCCQDSLKFLSHDESLDPVRWDTAYERWLDEAGPSRLLTRNNSGSPPLTSLAIPNFCEKSGFANPSARRTRASGAPFLLAIKTAVHWDGRKIHRRRLLLVHLEQHLSSTVELHIFAC